MLRFSDESRARVEANGKNHELRIAAQRFMRETIRAQYSYNFTWAGRPIIQYPQDIVAFQELVWQVRPDIIVETGIAHGGSLILSASLLAMLDLCEASERGELLDPKTPKRRVIGVDIDIRQHNRDAIEAHPLARRITMLQGSSIDPVIVDQVRTAVGDAKTVLLSLDSNHTHAHVLSELHAYTPMVTKGSYCVVFDTVIEDLSDDMFKDRPWQRGDNAKTAVHAFLKTNSAFEIDKAVENKLMITVAPDGFLKRIS
jgi:cephalosporin hydroxylase